MCTERLCIFSVRCRTGKNNVTMLSNSRSARQEMQSRAENNLLIHMTIVFRYVSDPPQNTLIEQDIAIIGGTLSCLTAAVRNEDYRWNISGILYIGQVIILSPVHEGQSQVNAQCCASNEIRGELHTYCDFKILDSIGKYTFLYWVVLTIILSL